MDNLSPEERRKQLIELITRLEVEEYKEFPQLEELLIEEEYEEAEEHFWNFYVAAWHVMEPGTEFKANWHMQMICEHLEAIYNGELHNLIISTPPRCSKSSIVNVAFPAWVWINKPHHKFLCACYGHDLAIRDSRATRNLITSDWYQKRWGNRFILAEDVNRLDNFQNDKGGYRMATSRGGRGTGYGYNCLLVDDPMKPKETASKKAVQEVINWWDQTLSSRNDDPNTSARAIFHQRYCENDLTGHILEQDLGYVHIDLPLLYEKGRKFYSPLGWTDPRTEEGEVLWPERFPPHEVNRLRKQLGPYGFAAQYQQNPVPKEGGIIKRDWLQQYNSPPDRFNWILSSWDLTFGETGNSYCVGLVIGVNGANKYLLQEYRGKWDFPAQLAMIRQAKKEFPNMRTVLIEDKAAGGPAIAMLKNEIPGIIPIKTNSSSGGKEIRLSACAPDFEAGNIYFPNPATNPELSWVIGHIEELVTFPRASNDDRVDALSQALNYIAEKGGGTKMHVMYVPQKVAGAEGAIDYALSPLEHEYKTGNLKKKPNAFYDTSINTSNAGLRRVFSDS